MRVAVLGGGLQGCCAALALAERGASVTLVDRNAALISKAGIANEGKIHLGYMYAGDPTLKTARTMMRGALAFAPFLDRHLGGISARLSTSEPASYVVHRDAQHSAAEIGSYLRRVHEMIAELPGARDGSYFGADLAAPPRRWSAAELDADFNAEIALDAFDTGEVAIDPVQVASALRARIADDPRIEVRLNCIVTGAADAGQAIRVDFLHGAGADSETFDHAVNALWDGRLALNEKAGLNTGRAWLHRLKYGVGFRIPEGARTPPSATFISGPFGEVVSYGRGVTYMTWYPTCLREICRDTAPPDWATFPADPLRSEIFLGTLAAMAEIMPSLRGLDPGALDDVVVKGGAIVAWGETDIYDPESELHRRYEIGLTSQGRFHSLDPGKLTMAPFFAEQCAERLLS
jgi:glycine/D-amino acid oxidase-like deaminating enzyme